MILIHLLVSDPNGLIRSAPSAQLANLGGGKTPQQPLAGYSSACDPKLKLPVHQHGFTQSHQFSPDSRVVTCPRCQETKAFLDDYKLQTGQEFVPDSQGE